MADLPDLSLLLKQVSAGSDATAAREPLLAIVRPWLADQRLAIKEEFLIHGDPDVLCAAQCAAIDRLLQALVAVFAQGEKECTLVAVGGYGRGELFPYSDIDLLFLYADSVPEQDPLAESILYILWDLGLKIGQSHQSLDSAIEASLADMTIRTTFLDARYLIGNESLFQRFQSRFQREVIEGHEVEFVEAKLAERDARHARFGDSRYLLEPNVKEGKGALRDLHTLWWLARSAYPVSSIADLVKIDVLAKDEYRRFDEARRFLWRVRIFLHYQLERAEERLTFDRQLQLAIAMGYGHPSANRAIERFMRRYFAAVRIVGTTTRIFCALLEEDKKRKPRKSLGWFWHVAWAMGYFKLDGERLNVRNSYSFTGQPLLMLELFRQAQAHGVDIHPRALQLIGRNLHLIASLKHDPRANALFLEILLGDHPEKMLGRMSEAGVLGRFLPDFGRITGQTQFNMYHVYTVDEHTLVALGILHCIEKGTLRDELPLATDIVHRLQMRRVLYLALFCHDIAKGRDGDHSELGEKIAVRLATRFGFNASEIDTCAWLVRYHLLFSATAFRRDIDDPKTIQDFVGLVRSPERLKLLLVLTAADIRAVGPAVWNAWKGALLRDLYTRAEQYMGTGQVALKKHQEGQFRQELAQRLSGWKERDIDAYLGQGFAAFWAHFDIARHAVIARMLREAETLGLPVLIDTRHTYEHGITEIILVAHDQPKLFAKISGALALAGANIISAKIYTLKNTMVVDVFQVQDASGQVFDRPDKLAKMSVYLEQALSSELNIEEVIRESKLQFSPSRDAMPVAAQVLVENDASAVYSVIELIGQDRAGFLYDVTNTIAELGLSIATAHVSTYGAQVADVFYVKDQFGMKITHDAKRRQVQEALLRAIG